MLLAHPLKPVVGVGADAVLVLTESSYIDIEQWTGEQMRADQRGVLKPLLEKGTR